MHVIKREIHKKLDELTELQQEVGKFDRMVTDFEHYIEIMDVEGDNDKKVEIYDKFKDVLEDRRKLSDRVRLDQSIMYTLNDILDLVKVIDKKIESDEENRAARVYKVREMQNLFGEYLYNK